MQSEYNMSINPDAIHEAVRRAGKMNTRIVEASDGKAKIEINEGGSWKTVQEGLSKPLADKLVNDATRNVILG